MIDGVKSSTEIEGYEEARLSFINYCFSSIIDDIVLSSVN